MQDVVALQGSVLRYRLARGRFPDGLDELLPDFAPPGGQIPRDPATGQPYHYRSTSGGADYEIGAVLSNGQTFPGVAQLHRERSSSSGPVEHDRHVEQVVSPIPGARMPLLPADSVP